MRRKNRYTEKRKRVTPYGQWQYPGEVTTIPDNNITMKGVPYPVLGVSDVGDMKMMMPGMDYLFNGSEVTEYPMMPKAQSGFWNRIKETGRKIVDSEARNAPSYKSDVSFKNAFDDASNKGYKTFYWNGKYYNTKKKEEDKGENPRRIMTSVGLVPYKKAPVQHVFMSTEPDKKIIYGTKEETRKRVYERFPVLKTVTDSIANEYNINPILLRTRLADEGFIDKIARESESNKLPSTSLEKKYTSEPIFKIDTIDISKPIGLVDFDQFTGFDTFGTDDIPNYISKKLVNPINEEYFVDIRTNEHTREVYPAEGFTWEDNIGLVAATLQGLREKAIKDFPGLSDNDYDRLANAYYNRGIEGGRNWWKNGGKGYNITNYQTGGIHINPKNKGKFTAAAQRAGKSVQAYAAQILANKENYSPTLIKRAVFAKNAAGWKHQDGGIGKYLEGNYVQPQTVDSVLQSWNDMMAKATGDADKKARLAGTILGLASTISGAAASQWGAAHGKQDWMNGKKKGNDNVSYSLSSRPDTGSTLPATWGNEIARQGIAGIQAAKYAANNPLNPFNNPSLPGFKLATGGNTATLAELENGEIVSGEEPLMFNGLNHENYGNQNETKKNVVALSNDADREVRENPQLTKMPYHTNPYETIRRIINGEFIFPSTVGLSGILEPRNGDDYWLARWINGLKPKR